VKGWKWREEREDGRGKGKVPYRHFLSLPVQWQTLHFFAAGQAVKGAPNIANVCTGWAKTTGLFLEVCDSRIC